MPEPTLQATALRYAARDLTAAEAAAFETRLTTDQDAREALAEAVRLSAAALGQHPPAAHRSFRDAVRDRFAGRRTYRGHPLAWVGLGGIVVAIGSMVGLAIAEGNRTLDHGTAEAAPMSPPAAELIDMPVAPPDGDPAILAAGGEITDCSVAEIWANLSTPNQVEKLHDEELRWRDKLRGLGAFTTGRSDRRDQ